MVWPTNETDFGCFGRPGRAGRGLGCRAVGERSAHGLGVACVVGEAGGVAPAACWKETLEAGGLGKGGFVVEAPADGLGFTAITNCPATSAGISTKVPHDEQT